MSTDISVGQTFYTPWLYYSDGGYSTRVKITWGIDSTDPINNTTTLWFTGTFESDSTRYGRGVRGGQVALYHKSYTDYGSGTNKIGDAYYFYHSGSTGSNYTYNGDIIYDWQDTSYTLYNRKITVSHGTGTTKDIYICVWFRVGSNDENNNAVDMHVVLPAVERFPKLRVRNGSNWSTGTVWVRNGSGWTQAKEVYVRNGSNWVATTDRGS